MALIEVPALMGPAPADTVARPFLVDIASGSELVDYYRLRHEAFVREQEIFAGSDRDDLDDDPRTIVLVARTIDGTVVGGVRLAPLTPRDIGWWAGSRLVVSTHARTSGAGIGSALVQAACALAEQRGVIRFDATVQTRSSVLFRRLGWVVTGEAEIAGVPHLRMRWPIDRYQRLVDSTKSYLSTLLVHGAVAGDNFGGAGWVGDDGALVPGTDVIAACDAILPSMVERDPEWAGWCAVLVNVNDLTAMGATAVGLMDAIAGKDVAFARRVLSGLRRASDAWGIPILGGHTQLGVPAALSVTALGRTDHPIPGGGARASHALTVTADLGGEWRSGHTGTQWNSSESRSRAELRALSGTVAAARPSAAKDVSMAGLVGTVGMLAEASGLGAVLDVDAIPVPTTAPLGDWLGCFPGFAMVTSDLPGESRMSTPLATSVECGTLTPDRGVQLRWPDGETTLAVTDSVTGLGKA